MKRFASLAISVFITVMAAAVPADKTRFLYRQPDGTTILLQRHGDEFLHWTTDASGRIVEKNARGFYVQSSMAEAERRAAIRTERAPKRAMWSSYDNPPVTNFGDRKILCLIANFTDSTFVIDNPREKFDAMLNSHNYGYNNAIGSVRDYYIDNSNGQYRPEFDVFGPVTLSHSSAYYDDGGGTVAGAILEAYELLRDQINIDDYDTDGDGDIDMVLFYYPGHNEAEGASEESIWPHQAGPASFGFMGGKNFVRYFCTSELRGASGTTMCPIGTTCHEFAHSLGLPDFYDTDNEKSGGHNENVIGQYDLMDGGCYNDLGRRPPYMNAVERNMLGWMDYPEEIKEGGDYSLEPITQNKAYMSLTEMEGEYFVFEYRTPGGWDSGLTRTGFLVYHVDKSKRKIPGYTITASQVWEYTNKINAYYEHPCFRLLKADDGTAAYPGPSGITSVKLASWDGVESDLYITGIVDSGNRLEFKVVKSSVRTIAGMVKDSDGKPVPGARVVLSKAAYRFQAPPLLKDDMSVTTDASGCYQFTVPDGFASIGILTATAEGYVPLSFNLKVNNKFTGQDITMVKLGEEVPYALRRYNPSAGGATTDFGVPDLVLAMKYSSGDMKEYVGRSVKSISFMAYAEQFTDVYVTIDFGTQRVLTKKVTDQYRHGLLVTVDVSGDNITIPAGKDVYFGFGITGMKNGDNTANYVVFKSDSSTEGNYYNLSVTSGSSKWGQYSFGEQVYYVPAIEAVIGVPLKTDFSVLGISYVTIDNNVPVVHPASGKTVKEIKWTVDGNAVADPTPVSGLPSGTHTYVASLIYYDGTTERVIYDYVR